MERLLDGFYTLSDQSMYDMLGWLAQEEGIRLEPSALAGMAGPVRVQANATHLVWVNRRRHGDRKTKWRNIWRRAVKGFCVSLSCGRGIDFFTDSGSAEYG